MGKRTNVPVRFRIIGGVLLILALILGANAHFFYVAVSSQPGCAEETFKTNLSGAVQMLRPAKEAC
jgi:hypothetical protein